MIVNGLRALIESVPDGFFVHDSEGRIVDVNQRSCVDLGYPCEALIGLTINDISCGATPAENAAHWAAAVPGAAMTFCDIARRSDGSTFPVEISLTCQIIDGQKLFLGLARDISEAEAGRAAIERLNDGLELCVEQRTSELRQARERLALAAQVGGLGIWDYDLVDDVLQCDEQWYRIMGRDPAEPISSIGAFRHFIHPEDVDRATEVRHTATDLVADGRNYAIIFRIVRTDGAIRWVRSAAAVLPDAQGAPRRAVGFVIDVTEAVLAEEQLKRTNLSLQEEREVLVRRGEELGRQALEDPLTGIANRRSLDQALDHACLRAGRTGETVSVAMVDVDFFKSFNDLYGHARGDDALRAVARLLAAALRRPYDLAARYGGEEFVLLLPATEHPEAVLARVNEELAALRLPHAGSPVAPHITISVGIAIATDLIGTSAADLLAASDRALYRAKQAGRNRVVVARL